MIYLVTGNQELFPNDTYTIIGVEESLRLLDPLTIVGLDTETTSLDCHTGQLKLLQLGCLDFQVVIDCSTVNILLYKDYLESDRLFLGWNLKFDLKWLFKYKIVPKKVYDGFLAEKLMWLGYPIGMHSMSLKSAGEEYLGIELDKSVRGKIIWSKELTEDIVEYAALDVKYLQQIAAKQHEELKKKDLLTAIEYENKFVLPLSYCEFCGIRLDAEKWKVKMAKDEEELRKAEEELNDFIVGEYNNKTSGIDKFISIAQPDLFGFTTPGPYCNVNWNSQKQVIPLLEFFGFDLMAKDKATGEMKKSVDAKVIKPQKNVHPIASVYLRYKAAQKVVSTYGENFLKQLNKDTGRIYTNYQQLGADTTRITSGGKDKSNNLEYINFLNFPSDADTRACMIAEKGNKWISIDYSGQETYLLASIANDEAIIKELTNGSGDIHSLTAYMAYKEIPRDTPIKDIKKLYHNLRQEAKGIEFAINYGGNADTIAMNKGIPIEEAQKIYNDYMSGFKGVKKYQDFCRKDVMEKGYILLSPLTGHKAYIYDFEELQRIKAKFKEPGFWDYYREMKASSPDCDTVQEVRKFFKRKSASEKQSINYRIQSAGSFCLRVALVNFFEYLRANDLLFKVLITVIPYDEVNIEAPEEIAEDIAKVLYDCMVKSGAYFCTRCKLDADISRLEDGSLPDFWIH